MDFDSVKRILFASAFIALPFVMFLGVMELAQCFPFQIIGL